MLDENLRVLGRRINDLELELEDKKDQNKALQNELDLQKQMLNKVSNKNDIVREEI
jgi:predicted RNase H-like nuclease (RuvC/YqgF family)